MLHLSERSFPSNETIEKALIAALMQPIPPR